MKHRLLRGNYKTKSKKVNSKEESEETQVAKFETEALEKIGGSISYVKGRKAVAANPAWLYVQKKLNRISTFQALRVRHQALELF